MGNFGWKEGSSWKVKWKLIFSTFFENLKIIYKILTPKRFDYKEVFLNSNGIALSDVKVEDSFKDVIYTENPPMAFFDHIGTLKLKKTKNLTSKNSESNFDKTTPACFIYRSAPLFRFESGKVQEICTNIKNDQILCLFGVSEVAG